METIKKYLSLFWTFFKIGLFTFGGGYAMISVILNEVVEKKNWLTQSEFLDVVALAESTPGPIAINSATYIGYKKGGLFGGILCSLAVTLPSLIIIYVISLFFNEFLQIEIIKKAFMGIECGVGVLILSAGIKLIKNIKKNIFSIILTCISLFGLLAVDFLGLNITTIYFVICGAILGIPCFYRPQKKVKEDSNV